MIINESVNQSYYRYTDEVHKVGDIIRGITPQERKINPLIVDIYSDKCNYDFSTGYTYMTINRDDESFDSFNYCYEVIPIGSTLVGNDGYSMDLCSDEITNESHNKFIDDNYIKSKAEDMSDKYISTTGKIMSAVSHACRVINVYNLSGGDPDEEN